MAGEPWIYFVPYTADIGTAVRALQQTEFAAGRFRGSEQKPASIDDARWLDPIGGTASILDIVRLSWEPGPLTMTPLSVERVEEYFGTPRPTREVAEALMDEIMQDIERGHAVCFVVYVADKAAELCFAGYSSD